MPFDRLTALEHRLSSARSGTHPKLSTAGPPEPLNPTHHQPPIHPPRLPKQSKTPPEYRLPLCYLMDSLLQNARAPYPGLFVRYVVPMLCRTYEFVSVRRAQRERVCDLPAWSIDPSLFLFGV